MKKRTKRTRRLAVQPLESRRVLAASFGWDGPGLGGATLTYNIANSPSSLSQSEVNVAFETALNAWSAAADINFVPTSQRGLRDSLDISFVNIDGRGGTLAQAYFPDDVNPARIAGDIQIDAAENWEIGNSQGRSAFDLVWVAAHEIGHALGLDHLNVGGTVLAPFVSPNTQFASLSRADINSIQQLYAPADTVTNSVDEQPTDDNDVANDNTTDTGTTENDDDDNRPNRRWYWRWFWRRWGGFRGRLQADVPEYHNMDKPTDVNGDNDTSAADALMVINQLNRPAGSGEGEAVDGMCDTNGDGEISGADALFVINTMNQQTSDAEQTEEDVVIIVDMEDPTDPADETDTADETDLDEPADEQNENGAVDDLNDDNVDPIDETDTAEDAPDETDQEGEETEQDDESDMDTEEDDDCPEGHFHERFRRGLRLLKRDGESVVSRFDSNGDGVITEEDVPSMIWEKLIDKDLDSDGDGSINAEEIDAAIASARAERFAALDTSGDGLLQEDEVRSRRWQKIVQADSNGDGAVSMDELDTWIQQRRMAKEQQIPDVPVDQVFAQIARVRNFSFRRGF